MDTAPGRAVLSRAMGPQVGPVLVGLVLVGPGAVERLVVAGACVLLPAGLAARPRSRR